MQTIERNEIFELAFRFVTETQESIFLTGKAGTGKTTFLKYLREHAAKNMIVAAPTGVAAINAGGVTLHSLFQLPLHPFLPTEAGRQQLLQNLRYNKQRTALLRKMELLVIDEVSMVRCDTLDAIDAILRSVRRQYHVPFGGVQLLYIGDLYQLPPVVKNEDWPLLHEFYAAPFFFDSKAVKEQSPLLVELNKIYRQKDEQFVDLLNKVRNNQMVKPDLDLLNSRYIHHFQPAANEKYITLTSHNNQADQINQLKLQKLSTATFNFEASIEGEFPENIYPADLHLVLKEGAQVMFIKNDTIEKKYFNGKLGIVTRLSNDRIVVTSDGREIEVPIESWENTRYTLNRNTGQLEQTVLGRFRQYPLRLAWAITIHKSQGLTFDKVMIDAAASFSSGQVYVALSRCTSLQGIVLLSRIPPSAIQSSDAVADAHQQLSHKGSLAERFDGARQVFTIQLLQETFMMEEVHNEAKHLMQLLAKHTGKLNEESHRWIKDFAASLDKESAHAAKFMGQVQQLLQQQPIIEHNEALQQRIQAAANYFAPIIAAKKMALQQHPIITEHKEVAGEVDEALLELLHTFLKQAHLLDCCRQPVTITNFLQHKLKLVIPRQHISCYAASKKQLAATDVPNAALYYSLRNWRDQVCEAEGLPIYMVANQESLSEIAAYLPLSKEQLGCINGFGRAKVERFGDAILLMVQDYCDEHGLQSNMEAKPVKAKRIRKTNAGPAKEDKVASHTITVQLFKQGKSIAEIAKERGLAQGTIEGHLASQVGLGDITLEQLVAPARAEHISAVINANAGKTFTDLKTLLGDNYSFAEIRAVYTHLQRLQELEQASQAQ